MIAAVTLLPGLLGLAGTKIDKLSIHRKKHVAKPAHETVSGRWAHHVGSHPTRYALASLVALIALAIPAASMRIGMADDGNAGKDKTERKAYDYLADGFGKGFNGPISRSGRRPDRCRSGGCRPCPVGAAGRPGRRGSGRSGVQRRGQHRHADRQPDDLAAGREDRRARTSPSVPTCSPQLSRARTPRRC